MDSEADAVGSGVGRPRLNGVTPATATVSRRWEAVMGDSGTNRALLIGACRSGDPFPFVADGPWDVLSSATSVDRQQSRG